MHDPHRQYKTCIFCNTVNPTLTNEHIYGKSVAKHFPGLPNWEIPVVDGLKQVVGKESIKGGGSILSTGIRCVCGPCNNVGLKVTALDNARPFVFELADSTLRTLTSEIQDAVLRYFERIAALMDVETSNHELDPNHPLPIGLPRIHRMAPPILSQADRVAWLAGVTLKTYACTSDTIPERCDIVLIYALQEIRFHSSLVYSRSLRNIFRLPLDV